jgi:hypothetical protein
MADTPVNGKGKNLSDIQTEINKSIDALDTELREINLKVFSLRPFSLVQHSDVSRSIKIQN